MSGFSLKSTLAFILYSVLLTGGYVWSSFYEAPYLAFATQLTIGFGVYITKRLIQKKTEYNDNAGE